MKRVICLLLAVVMTLALVACGSGSEKKSEKNIWEGLDGIHIGYGKAVYTPGLGVPMGGYGQVTSRLSTGVISDLYLICLAITDGEDIFLLYAMDACTTAKVWNRLARETISEATGIPEDRIIICSTHTHSAPDLGTTPESFAANQETYDNSLAAAVEAAEIALNDLAPTTISGATVETEGMAFVRHYLLSDGSYAGDNFGDFNNGVIVDHAMANDPQMVLVKFEREGANDILLMNFQVHPCLESAIDQTNLSADLVGRTRDYLEEQTGMDVIYFTGAAGNQNSTSKIRSEAHGLDAYGYAEKLGNYAIEALNDMTLIEGDDVKITHYDYTGDVWMPESEEQVENARKVQEYYNQTDRATATPMAKEYGFHSVYHVNAVVNHSTMDPTYTIELNAFNIGGLGLITAPYEMFSLQGTYIKQNSPFDFTVVCSMAGPHSGYIPSEEAFVYGSYETQTGRFVSGTAEIVADKFVEMLGQVK